METLISWAIDVALALLVVGLAWRALASTDLFKAIVLFIAFGLVLTLVWVRLNATDVALAEAAIGAGVTGALLLAAYAKLRAASPDAIVDHASGIRGIGSISLLILILLVAAALGYALWTLPSDYVGLGKEVAANLHQSGVSNPVTAVLLNFRGYDTLLELMVLLLALLGAWSLRTAIPRPETAPGLMLDTLSRLLVPLLILIAAYLLWVGAHAPGGAFQAGAVLAAAGVLMLLSGRELPAALATWPLRLALVLGPATFLILAVITLILEGRVLKLSPEWAGRLILIIETTATISIGVTLTTLFMGAPPGKEDW